MQAWLTGCHFFIKKKQKKTIGRWAPTNVGKRCRQHANQIILFSHTAAVNSIIYHLSIHLFCIKAPPKRALHSRLQGLWSPSQLSGRRPKKKEEKTTLCSFIKNTEPKCMSPEHSMITQNSNVSLNESFKFKDQRSKLTNSIHRYCWSALRWGPAQGPAPCSAQITIWGWQSQMTTCDWLQCIMTYDY